MAGDPAAAAAAGRRRSQHPALQPPDRVHHSSHALTCLYHTSSAPAGRPLQLSPSAIQAGGAHARSIATAARARYLLSRLERRN